jgi:hypothetical protein
MSIFLKAAGVLKLNSYWFKGYRKPLVGFFKEAV